MSIPTDADDFAPHDDAADAVDSVSSHALWLDPAPGAENLFASEIENLDVSDWDVDTSLIWGDDAGAGPDDGGAAAAFHFPL